MQKSYSNLVHTRVPGTLGGLLVLIGFVIIGMAVGNILAIIILALLTSSDVDSITALLTTLFEHPEKVPNGWLAMMVLQGTVHFFSYLLPSLLYWFYMEKKKLEDFNFRVKPAGSIWLLTCMLVLVFIPVNSLFIDWNSKMVFPGSWSWLEKWMREKEDQNAMLTQFMTNYKQAGQLIIALIVIVLLPAVGEEVLFRGIIQRKLAQHWANVHVAIWISAAVFSAIHFQFFGFLPRMILGALFGYLYYWSGRLSVAILAHFINNGFVLVMMFLYNIKVLEINIEETKTMPFTSILASAVLTAGILYEIRKRSIKQQTLVE
jgi:membrane protease YdiL (CAAX protease family)